MSERVRAHCFFASLICTTRWTRQRSRPRETGLGEPHATRSPDSSRTGGRARPASGKDSALESVPGLIGQHGRVRGQRPKPGESRSVGSRAMGMLRMVCATHLLNISKGHCRSAEKIRTHCHRLILSHTVVTRKLITDSKRMWFNYPGP